MRLLSHCIFLLYRISSQLKPHLGRDYSFTFFHFNSISIEILTCYATDLAKWVPKREREHKSLYLAPYSRVDIYLIIIRYIYNKVKCHGLSATIAVKPQRKSALLSLVRVCNHP